MLSEIVTANMDINEEYKGSNMNPFLFNPQNGLFVPKEWKEDYLDQYHGCLALDILPGLWFPIKEDNAYMGYAAGMFNTVEGTTELRFKSPLT